MPHSDWDKLRDLWPAIVELQKLASVHGIDDVFQDNGGKILQMLLALNIQGIPGREGNDAVDIDGREYELKSVNILLTSGFSTNHHVNIPIIDKYRQVQWVFAIYEGITIRRAYQIQPAQLEVYFSAWEQQWTASKRDINNPKIPLKFVIEHGVAVYTDDLPLDLAAAQAIRTKRTKESANRRKAKKLAQEQLIDLLEHAEADDATDSFPDVDL